MIFPLSWEIAVGIGIVGGGGNVFGIDFERIEESIVDLSVVSGHREGTSGDNNIVSGRCFRSIDEFPGCHVDIESLGNGTDIGYTFPISGIFLVPRKCHKANSSKNGEDGDDDDEFHKGENQESCEI